MLLIKNGRVVDPVTNTDRKLDVLVDGAVITEVEQQIDPEACREKYGTDDVCVIDAEGLVVAPGLVDTHVHFRDPGFTYKEDIETGAEAAAYGGFTTVICMANTKPAVDNVETLEYIQRKGETTGIHVIQTATVTKDLKGKELVDMELLAEHGVKGRKVHPVIVRPALARRLAHQRLQLGIAARFAEVHIVDFGQPVEVQELVIDAVFQAVVALRDQPGHLH